MESDSDFGGKERERVILCGAGQSLPAAARCVRCLCWKRQRAKNWKVKAASAAEVMQRSFRSYVVRREMWRIHNAALTIGKFVKQRRFRKVIKGLQVRHAFVLSLSLSLSLSFPSSIFALRRQFSTSEPKEAIK